VSWIKNYQTRCGTRSFIFQCCLLGWTVLMLMMIAPSLETPSNQQLREQSVNPYNPNEVSMYRVSTVACPIGLWAIITLPLGIAAIATLKKG